MILKDYLIKEILWMHKNSGKSRKISDNGKIFCRGGEFYIADYSNHINTIDDSTILDYDELLDILEESYKSSTQYKIDLILEFINDNY